MPEYNHTLFDFREFTEGKIVDLLSHAKLSIDDMVLIANDRAEGKELIKYDSTHEFAISVEFIEVAYQ